MWTSPLNDSSITWMVVSTGCYQCSKSSSLSGSEWHVTVHPNPPQICSSAHDAAHTEVTRSLPRALCWCIFSTWWQYRAIYNDQPVELKITSSSCTAHYIKWLGNARSLIYYPNKLCRCTYMVGIFAELRTRESSVSWAEANNVTVVSNSFCSFWMLSVENCGGTFSLRHNGSLLQCSVSNICTCID